MDKKKCLVEHNSGLKGLIEVKQYTHIKSHFICFKDVRDSVM